MSEAEQDAARASVDSTEAASASPAAEPSALAKKAADPDALRSSVVDAASVSGGLWISYLGVLVYLLIAIGSVTHKDLLLESPIMLPLVSVNVPVTGFFWLGPALLLIVHVYVLLHFVMLAGKIEAYDNALVAPGSGLKPPAETTLRGQLPANIFVQFLAGPPDVRDGATGMFAWLIALISLVIGPILLLLFFELQFLPYHNELITWWQRVAVWIDLGLLWVFWPKIALRTADAAPGSQTRRYHFFGAFQTVGTIQNVGTKGIMWALTVGSVPLLLLIATFPGEKLEQVVQDWVETPARALIPKQVWIPVRVWLVGGAPNELTRRPVSLFSNRLVLPGFDAIDHVKLDTEAKIAAATATLSLRGRDLRGAVLSHASLRKVDFAGAHLEGAVLDHADLREAYLGCASNEDIERTGEARQRSGEKQNETCTHLEGAELSEAQLQGDNLFDAYLQGADLAFAHLQGANLNGAVLNRNPPPHDLEESKANAGGVQLQGANLEGTELQGADLKHAYLVGASLLGANLKGAELIGARLQGADLVGAELEGADLANAQLQGARLYINSPRFHLVGTQLQGADVNGAKLQGADLTNAQFAGTSLVKVSVWSTDVTADGLKGAWVTGIKSEKWNKQIGSFPAATLSERIAKMTLTIPVGSGNGRLKESTREKAEERLERNLIKNPSFSGPDQPDQPDQYGAVWDRAQHSDKSAGFDEQVYKIWREIGCDASGAPYVSRQLIRRLNDDMEMDRSDISARQRAAGLAKQLLAADCEGSKSLLPEDSAALKKIILEAVPPDARLAAVGPVVGLAESPPAAPPQGKAVAAPSPETPPPAQIKGEVLAVSVDGWPIVGQTTVHLSGVDMIAAGRGSQILEWIKSHGSYLECDPSDGGTYRCFTAQVDLGQALLLNGASRATANADPLYRAAEKTARDAKRGVWHQ